MRNNALQSCKRLTATTLSEEQQIIPPVAKWLKTTLENAEELYKENKYADAANLFSAALQDCTKGGVLAHEPQNPVNINFEDLSKSLGFIESRLAACYIEMKQPDLALPHVHRSIHQNPICYHSHIQQAMVYKSLGKPCMAVRSAMIADYVHWLCGNGNPAINTHIKVHWQNMLEEAVCRFTEFSLMYTPCSGKPTRKQIQEAEQALKNLSPSFSAYIYTDSDGGHLLPCTTDWSKSSVTSYILTVGFKNEQDGIFLNNLLHKNSHMSTGPQDPFMFLSPDSPENMCETFKKKILPLLEFINCNKLAAGFSNGSGVIERLQYSDFLHQLGKLQEHEQVLEQTLADLAVAPYLQDISPPDTRLLTRLTADTMGILAGKKTHQKCVWNEVKQQMATFKNIGPTINPLSVILGTNSKDIPQQRPSPEVRTLSNWEPYLQSKQPMLIFPQQPWTLPTHLQQTHQLQPQPQPTYYKQPQPQQNMFTQPQPQQITFTQLQPQQIPFTQPQPQQIPFTQPQPQQMTLTQPQPHQITVTQPQPHQITFTQPQLQQTTFIQPQTQQTTITQPQPQQTMFKQPESWRTTFKQRYTRKSTFKEPYPQKTTFKQSHPEQPMFTHPQSQQIVFGQSHSQQPGYKNPYPRLVKLVQLCK